MIFFKNLFKDARNFQILYLTTFLTYGLFNLDWMSQWPFFVTAILAVVLAQYAFEKIKFGQVRGIKSALISGLGICLLMRTNSIGAIALASFIAIAAKFLIRYNGKHIFNPSNIGIIALLVISDLVWVSPGQWGNDVALFFLITVTGLIVLLKVGRLDISLIFLATLFLMEYCRTILYLGWEWDVLLHKFSNGSLLLFTFFMITDPKTTPDHPRVRVLWAMLLAALTFMLSQWFYLYTASIWALFIITPVTMLVDKYFPAKRYAWLPHNTIAIDKK